MRRFVAFLFALTLAACAEQRAPVVAQQIDPIQVVMLGNNLAGLSGAVGIGSSSCPAGITNGSDGLAGAPSGIVPQHPYLICTPVSAAANNGSGLIRLTVTSAADLTTGSVRAVSGITGTGIPANPQTITVIDGAHVDLQGSTASGSYVLVNAALAETARPAWSVAGVDYPVGFPSSPSLTDWYTYVQAGHSGVTMSGSSAPYLVTVTGSSIVLSGVDFSTSASHGNAELFLTSCTSCTVENSNFGPGTVGYGTGSYIIDVDSGSPNFTFNYNTVDGNGLANVGVPGSNMSDLIVISGGGTETFEYNWIKNGSAGPLEVGSPSVAGTLVYKYDFIDNTYPPSGAHMHWLQWNGWGNPGTITGLQISYNTSFQSATGGAEGYQLDGGFTGCTCSFNMISPSLDHNVEIALPNSGNTMSYLNHGSSITSSGVTFTNTSGSPTANNNYIDQTGGVNYPTSQSAFYPGSFQAFSGGGFSSVVWAFSNNTNMATGAAFPTTPP